MENSLQIIIFGASGDLTSTKLMPALYNLFQRRKLPEEFTIIGFSRRDWSQYDFAKFVEEEFVKSKIDMTLWQEFSSRFQFIKGEFTDLESYKKLRSTIKEFDIENNGLSNKIFYLSVPPIFYDEIFENIQESGLNTECADKTCSKVVIEKPFGRNYQSAVELNEKLGSIFDEEQIYRIDHVLGKDTLVDIQSFRENNFILSQLLKGELVDHIQISFLESKSIGTRGSFYEKTGVVRDMLQNHLPQMLAVATMDVEIENKWQARNEIIKSIEPLKKENMIIGQYEDGENNMKPIIAYRKEKDVDQNSLTPTFFAGKTFLNSGSWNKTPVYFRSGKALKNKYTEVTFVFKSKNPTTLKPNMLSFRIQPQEGVYLVLSKRDLSKENELENIHLDFCYKYNPKSIIRDAYENLLLQVIKGDRTYFVDISEVLSGWKFADNINNFVENEKSLELEFYKAGSWGPKGSYDLIERDGRKWYTEDFELVCRI